MTSPKVYVIHHDAENYPLFQTDTVIPILAGNPTRNGYRIDLRDTAGGQCITDTEQQDIYSEFTALYYIWKNLSPNDPSALIGVMHYRSFLDLRNGAPSTGTTLESRFGYDTGNLMLKFTQLPSTTLNGTPAPGPHGVEAIVSEPLSFSNGIYQQYDACHPMASTLFKKAKELLDETQYPGAKAFFDDHFSLGQYSGQKRCGFFKCLLLCSWRYYDAYCSFIFHILDGLYHDKEVRDEMQQYEMIKGPDNPQTQKKTRFRLLAFFAERMTSFFIAYCIQAKRFRIGIVPRCHCDSMKTLVEQVYPSLPDKMLTPMVRAYNPDTHDHKAITNLTELDDPKQKDYYCEGLLGHIYTKQLDETTPVCRYLLMDFKHICTKDTHRPGGFWAATALGYAAAAPKPSENVVLHLEEYTLTDPDGGNVTTTNPKEFPEDPLHPFAKKVEDLGYLTDIQGLL